MSALTSGVAALLLLQQGGAAGTAADASPRTTQIGEPNAVAMVFFFVFIAITLGITYWASRKTRTTEDFYAAGRSISAGQNGFALAGDYMSAASFLGIAGLVSTTGFDGLIYSTGWLVGWPVVLFGLFEGAVCAVVRWRSGLLASTLSHGLATFLLSFGLFSLS